MLDDEAYFADHWVDGAIAIGHLGCGITPMLVVTGPEAGNIWVDDRCSDYGIYPAIVEGQPRANRLGFLSWYTQWLDAATIERTHKLSE